MDLERLQALLDAYGADPERWPPEDRAAGLALVARSSEARRARDGAAALDRVLDLAPAVEPSPELGSRVLAAVPRRRRAATVRRLLAMAAPLAAAAGLVVWLTGTPPELTPETVAALSTYESPTDVLLAPSGFDLTDAAPSYGCEDGELGCLDLAPADERDSSIEKGRFA